MVSTSKSVELLTAFIALFTILIWHPVLFEVTLFVLLSQLKEEIFCPNHGCEYTSGKAFKLT